MRLLLYQNGAAITEDNIPFAVISGGQTGVDRAALDAALAAKVPCGGWCPKGRLALDGTISLDYPLTETSSPDYADRTRQNIQSTQGTLVLHKGKQGPGTRLTIAEARRLGKPFLVVDIRKEDALDQTTAWLQQSGINILNIAGPRESSKEGIYDDALRFIAALIRSVEQEG